MLAGLLVFMPFAFAIADYIFWKKNEKRRDTFLVIFTFVELLVACLLFVSYASGGNALSKGLDIGLVFTSSLSLRVDGFRVLYSVVTALMWAFTTLFSIEYFRNEREHLNRYYFFVLLTLSATEGVMLSGDLITTYLFFEILSLTSFTWVAHEQTAKSLRAGYTYLFIAVIGGLILFMGMALLQNTAGTLSYRMLPKAIRDLSGNLKDFSSDLTGTDGVIMISAVCILLGFGCKAGMFPVHVWLPKAHPVAPAPASALLSGILTKVGIYGILMVSVQVMTGSAEFGWIVLILGTITMLLGAVLALFSVDLKRTLACSSMSQIGFILVGIGMTLLLSSIEGNKAEGGLSSLGIHSAMAISGTMLHMVNHSLLKLSLFCAAGVVVMNIHELDLNRIRGFGRNKRILKAAFLLGLAGIGGVPMFNGYMSKTLLHESITAFIEMAGEGGTYASAGLIVLHMIEWMFLFAGGCTLAYMLKLFICIFVEKNADPERQAQFDNMCVSKKARVLKGGRSYMGWGSVTVVFGTSLLFVLLGQKSVCSYLASFMTGHSDALAQFKPLSWESIKGALISLLAGMALYLLFIRLLLMKRSTSHASQTLPFRLLNAGGEYVNRWPSKLDLEDMIYRPMLTKYLPRIFGALMSVLGENMILKRVCIFIFSLGSAASKAVEKSRFIEVAGCALFFLLALVCRALETSTDALIVFLRHTILADRVITGRKQMTVNLIHGILEEKREAYSPIIRNFSFALMLSCAGMLIIFGVLLFFIFN